MCTKAAKMLPFLTESRIFKSDFFHCVWKQCGLVHFCRFCPHAKQYPIWEISLQQHWWLQQQKEQFSKGDLVGSSLLHLVKIATLHGKLSAINLRVGTANFFFFAAAFRSFFSLSVCHYQKKSFRNASMSKLMNFSLMHRKASPGIEQQTLLNCNFYALFKWDNLHLIRIFLPRANIALL